MTVCYAGLQVYPHPDSCNHYYKCANGSLTLETCGNGLLFNEATALRGTANFQLFFTLYTYYTCKASDNSFQLLHCNENPIYILGIAAASDQISTFMCL
jgi:hypothetical protein